MAGRKLTVRETVDAKKVRFAAGDLAELFGAAGEAQVVKGKAVVAYQWSGGKLPAELKTAVLGPSGNLRAPTARAGRTWVVGFAPETWDKI